jgi:hypothetical protein
VKIYEAKWDPSRRAWVRGLSRFSVLCIALACAVVGIGAVTQIDLTSQVRNILPSANGGTGSAFFGISGPSALRTFTFPDANGTVMMTTTSVNATQLPNPSASTLGGTQSKDCTGSGHIVAISTSGVPSCAADAAGPNFDDQLTPTGTVDGTNAAFTTAHSCTAASVMLFKNGQLMAQGAGADYTYSGSTATYTAGAKPKSGDVHVYSCRY